ncbi:hypothetical protein HRbin39_01209 [bacterium HR39]|nr:hypothetical protein HRbin39_01209 [bacterium HR39]
MRLDPDEVTKILEIVRETAGPDAEVRLFGSRLDDSARGGDVDLLLSLPRPVQRPAVLATRLEACISRALGGRKVDVVLEAPNLRRTSIHEHARRTGVRL